MTAPMTREVGLRPAIRLLLVEDESAHAELVMESLEGGHERFEVFRADSLSAARQMLEAKQFDCVLLDHNLPDGQGVDLLEEFEDQLLTTPVIGLSTSTDPEVALSDFRLGCVEFIRKHEAFSAKDLRERVLESLALARRRLAAAAFAKNELQTTHEALISSARIDALTGVCNRAVFEDCMENLRRRPADVGGAYAIVLLDIDNFKLYNDHYGHSLGDRTLRAVAGSLASTLRGSDVLARYGGEEFVVIIESTTCELARGLAGRLVQSVTRLKIPHAHNADYRIVTISAGVAVSPPRPADPLRVLETADRALYQAKLEGRNRACAMAILDSTEEGS